MGICKSKSKNRVAVKNDDLAENQKEIEKKRISENDWVFINNEWYFVHPPPILKRNKRFNDLL